MCVLQVRFVQMSVGLEQNSDHLPAMKRIGSQTTSGLSDGGFALFFDERAGAVGERPEGDFGGHGGEHVVIVPWRL